MVPSPKPHLGWAKVKDLKEKLLGTSSSYAHRATVGIIYPRGASIYAYGS